MCGVTAIKLFFKNTSLPTFQRRINVVSKLGINVENQLIWCWEWNKIQRRVFNVAQHWYKVRVQRWNNVHTTLSKHCFNVASTLVKAISKSIGLVITLVRWNLWSIKTSSTKRFLIVWNLAWSWSLNLDQLLLS